MSPRDSRWNGNDRRGTKRSKSVVGSKISEISHELGGSRLPRGGIREQDGLKVAEGALPDTTFIGGHGSRDKRATGHSVLRTIAIVSGSLAAILLVVFIVLAILGRTSMFSVTTVQAHDSEHLTAENIVQLANVAQGTTLINVDDAKIEEGVKRNPWVASVNVERVFPDTLVLTVQERVPSSLVAMESGGSAWLLGSDNVWIEPFPVETKEMESFNDSALTTAQEKGLILICNVPLTVSPVAGQQATDECIQAVSWFYDQLTPEFRDQVVCYSASSDDDISCILNNGVEVSFGQVSNVDTKESVARRILDEFGGQVTYINVRVPTHPTYRRVNSTYVREGSGATGSLLDQEDTVQKERAYTSESGSSSTSGQGQGEQNYSQEEYNSYGYTGDESGQYSEYDYGYEDYGTGQYDTTYV